jgi:hypothetical protein
MGNNALMSAFAASPLWRDSLRRLAQPKLTLRRIEVSEGW